MLATWFLTLGALAWAAEVPADENCDSPAAEVSFLQVDLDVDKSMKMVPQFEMSKSGHVVLPGRKTVDLEPAPALKPMYSEDSLSSMLEGTPEKTEKMKEIAKAVMHPEMDVSEAGDVILPGRKTVVLEPAPAMKPMYSEDSLSSMLKGTPEKIEKTEETPERFTKGWLKRLLQVKSTPYPQAMMFQKNEAKKQRKASSSHESSSETNSTADLDPEQHRVLLTQLVASSFAGEHTAVKTKDSLTSLLINILVLGLVFALGVLLYTNGWNWQTTVSEIERDPKIVYKQFEQGGQGRQILDQNGFITGRRSASTGCC